MDVGEVKQRLALLDKVAAIVAVFHVLPDKMNAFAKMGQDSRV
tara:strand:+ start:15648 stop:15776 length:129 start_codon:yes stop_codon:yes gene_type:complete